MLKSVPSAMCIKMWKIIRKYTVMHSVVHLRTREEMTLKMEEGTGCDPYPPSSPSVLCVGVSACCVDRYFPNLCCVCGFIVAFYSLMLFN